MFRKILVPTDGSEYSQRALEISMGLAKVMDSGIILLHVSYDSQLMINAELAFKATLNSLDAKGIGLKEKVASGHPAVAILEEAERSYVDLIVMGSHGHGPFRGAVLGSVAQRVLSHAVCPVLIVR